MCSFQTTIRLTGLRKQKWNHSVSCLSLETLALSEDDIHNALVAQIAKHTYQTRIVVCRIDDRKLHEMYTAIGVHAINTADISSELFLGTAGN